MRSDKSFLNKLTWLFFITVTGLVFAAHLQAAPVRFIVAGDSRGAFGGTPTNEVILSEIATATIAEGADFILVPGDLVWGYSSMGSLETQLADWISIMQPVYDAGIGVYPIRGNHEMAQDDNTGTDFRAAFSGAYALPTNGPAGETGLTYSFDRENVFVVGLDQYFEGDETHKVNQTWLDEQFEANTLPHVFVFGQEPAFFVGNQTSLDLNPVERNIFWESIAAEGGRTYFHCHDHKYINLRIDEGDGNPDNDIYQIDTATITSSFYAAPVYTGNNAPYTPVEVFYEINNYGYVVVDVDGNNVTITWKHRTASGVYEAGGDVFTYTVDNDGDTVTNEIDNCPSICNSSQLDADDDGMGDVCDSEPGCGGCGQPTCEVSCDLDSDSIPDSTDNCPSNCNTQQTDADGDGTGDVCDDTPGCGGCGQSDCETEC